MRSLVTLLLFTICSSVARATMYPDDHFDYVTEIKDREELNELIKKTSKKGHTLFVRWISDIDHADCLRQAPTWNRAVKAFADHKKVVFGDINLSEAETLKGAPHWPSRYGWPTIRYFNRETGEEGADYVQKTNQKVYDELRDFDVMVDYIEQAGNTILCDLNGKFCNKMEKDYIKLVKKKSLDELIQLRKRLYAMDVNLLVKEIQEWNLRRRRILTKLVALKEKESEKATTGNEL